MVAVIDFKDLPREWNYKIVNLESVEWNGKKVSVFTLSSRHSSIIERIIDFVLLILIAVPTMGAGLAFPFAVDIQKSAFKGRKHIYHIRRSTLPKLDWKKTDSKKNVFMESEGRQLSLRLDPQSSSLPRSEQNNEYKSTVGQLAELGLQEDEIVESMDGSGIQRETILEWVREQRAASEADLELTSEEGSPRVKPQPGPLKVHKDQAKYDPLKVVLAAQDLNQRRAGFPNGCTHFSVRFLEKPKSQNATPDLLKSILENENAGIVQGRNGDPLEVIQGSSVLQVADQSGNPYNDSIPVLLFHDTVQGKKEILQKTIKDLTSERRLAGFVITTGTESFAVRFRPDSSLEFFDPHGDVLQEEPTSVFVFSKEEGPRKIVEMIFDRAALIIEETGQLEIVAAMPKQ